MKGLSITLSQLALQPLSCYQIFSFFSAKYIQFYKYHVSVKEKKASFVLLKLILDDTMGDGTKIINVKNQSKLLKFAKKNKKK